MSPYEIVELLDEFRKQAQHQRSSPEGVPAGKKILSLPPDNQRQIFLALYGCLLEGVEAFVSRGQGLEYMNKGWSLQSRHAELGIRGLPLSDSVTFAAL